MVVEGQDTETKVVDIVEVTMEKILVVVTIVGVTTIIILEIIVDSSNQIIDP